MSIWKQYIDQSSFWDVNQNELDCITTPYNQKVQINSKRIGVLFVIVTKK